MLCCCPRSQSYSKQMSGPHRSLNGTVCCADLSSGFIQGGPTHGCFSQKALLQRVVNQLLQRYKPAEEPTLLEPSKNLKASSSHQDRL